MQWYGRQLAWVLVPSLDLHTIVVKHERRMNRGD